MKEELGIVQMPDTQSATRWDIHDDYHYESLVAVSRPRLLRETERAAEAGRFSIYGVDLESTEQVDREREEAGGLPRGHHDRSTEESDGRVHGSGISKLRTLLLQSGHATRSGGALTVFPSLQPMGLLSHPNARVVAGLDLVAGR